MLTVKGVVLTQKPIGEQDRFIDILTADYGVIEVLVKGASKINSKSGSASQLFAYSEFSLADRPRGGYILNSVSPIQIFYGLRSSVSAVTLAAYFSQTVQFSVLPKAGTPEILRLLLNCLYCLSEKKLSESMVKCIFELRTAALLGFMPDVIMCRACGCFLPEELIFFVEDGCFCCRDCSTESDEFCRKTPMPAGSLQAIRHIVLQDLEKIFSFRVSQRCEGPLFSFAEEFLQYHLDRRLPTLDYYKAVSRPVTANP